MNIKVQIFENCFNLEPQVISIDDSNLIYLSGDEELGFTLNGKEYYNLTNEIGKNPEFKLIECFS
jgi:hypothetical protein